MRSSSFPLHPSSFLFLSLSLLSSSSSSSSFLFVVIGIVCVYTTVFHAFLYCPLYNVNTISALHNEPVSAHRSLSSTPLCYAIWSRLFPSVHCLFQLPVLLYLFKIWKSLGRCLTWHLSVFKLSWKVWTNALCS